MTDRESASGTFIWSPAYPAIIDGYGNAWTMTASHQVAVDGQVDPTTRNVVVIGYINRRVWQWNDQRLWWSKDSPLSPWLPTAGTPDAPFGPTPDPRIDTLQGSISLLSVDLRRDMMKLSGALQVIQDDIDELPREQIPDPRIDVIDHRIAYLYKTLAEGIAAVQADAQVRDTLINARLDVIVSQLDAVTAADGLLQSTLADLATQIHRVVVILLDAFPAKPPPRLSIHADLSGGRPEGTQTAPGTHGP